MAHMFRPQVTRMGLVDAQKIRTKDLIVKSLPVPHRRMKSFFPEPSAESFIGSDIDTEGGVIVAQIPIS